MRWKLAALAMLAGCGRCAHVASEGVADGGADAIVIDATPRDASTDAKPHARVPTPEERKRYDDALGRARKATVAKSYAVAIAAFDEALTAIPNDARATSERGYARLLSGDDKRAEKDFNAAVDEVPKSDKKLTAQIISTLVSSRKSAANQPAHIFDRLTNTTQPLRQRPRCLHARSK